MISQCFKFKVYTVSLFGRKKNCIRFTSKIFHYRPLSLHEISS